MREQGDTEKAEFGITGYLKSPWLAEAQKGWQPFPGRTTTVAMTTRTGEAEGRAGRWEWRLLSELDGKAKDSGI